MSPDVPITPLHTFGWKNEAKLKKSIEALLHCEITKSEDRFATFDYEAPLAAIEIKSRPGASTDYDTWLVPSCKLEHPEAKWVMIFYYWEADNKLFLCEPEKHEERCEWFTDIPHWKTTQEHTWIPREFFEEIPILN